MRSPLSVCVFLKSEELAYALVQVLSHYVPQEPRRVNYFVSWIKTESELIEFAEQLKQQIDCLIFQEEPELPQLLTQLLQRNLLLPAVILKADALENGGRIEGAPEVSIAAATPQASESTYHPATVFLYAQRLNDLARAIDQAITEFLKLVPGEQIRNYESALTSLEEALTTVGDSNKRNSLLLQQQRLSEKLKERLGYLGVYYRRNPKNFLRDLPSEERQQFIEQLKRDYREIILNYFSKDETLNQKIDAFVSMAFFADVPVSQIVEIHMELMDTLSKQLRLEGRSEEILLDYRLTLIDTIAHLCEMYRRSIPKES